MNLKKYVVSTKIEPIHPTRHNSLYSANKTSTHYIPP